MRLAAQPRTQRELRGSGSETSKQTISKYRWSIAKGGFLLLTIVAVFAVNFQLPGVGSSSCGEVTNPASAKTIALVNTIPEGSAEWFISQVSSLANASGYTFSYYAFGQASVDFFRHLPEMGFSIVLLRAHTADGGTLLTTSENYSPYMSTADQLANRLARVRVNGTFQDYFAVTPSFVTNMCGRFPGTIVMSMGCGGPTVAQLADGFVHKGARAFIGWNNTVSLGSTDQAFVMLLQTLTRSETIGAALQHVATEVARDPVFPASLSLYPLNATSIRL
jgi:hypothetical protein